MSRYSVPPVQKDYRLENEKLASQNEHSFVAFPRLVIGQISFRLYVSFVNDITKNTVA